MAVVDVAYQKGLEDGRAEQKAYQQGWEAGRAEFTAALTREVSELIAKALYLRQPYEGQPWFFEECDKTVPGAMPFYPRSAVVAIQQAAVAVGYDVGYRLAKGTKSD